MLTNNQTHVHTYNVCSSAEKRDCADPSKMYKFNQHPTKKYWTGIVLGRRQKTSSLLCFKSLINVEKLHSLNICLPAFFVGCFSNHQFWNRNRNRRTSSFPQKCFFRGLVNLMSHTLILLDQTFKSKKTVWFSSWYCFFMVFFQRL